MRIETRDFFERLVGGWTSQAQAQGILVTRLGMLPTWEPALGVGEIIGVLEMMMDSAMAATLPGGLIEVMVDGLHGNRDWLRITIRNDAGGQVEKATLPTAAYRQAALLAGFIDITTYPGRQTAYSLYLPQDTLLRWLSYQSPSSRLYLISRRSSAGFAASPGKPDNASFEAGLAMANQRGRLRRLNETEYLYAGDGSRLPEASLAAASGWASLEPDWDWHDLGPILDFLGRVAELAEAEQSQPSTAAGLESPTARSLPKPLRVPMTNSLPLLEGRDRVGDGESERSSLAATWSAHPGSMAAAGSKRSLASAADKGRPLTKGIRQRPRRVASPTSMRKRPYLDFIRPVVSA
jgi:hypothetical protein